MTGNTDVIRILIADDHPMVREGLSALLKVSNHFTIVGEATNGEETLTLTRQTLPDILLLDVAMPGLTGFDVLRRLSNLTHTVRVILLTASIERAQIIEALRLGARGVVSKGSPSEILFKSIECVMDDQVWISRDCVRDLVSVLRATASGQGDGDVTLQPVQVPTGQVPQSVERVAGAIGKYGLTARELEIVSAIVDGQSNRDIALTYGISEYTVKHHLTRIFDKVGVFSRLELAVFAIHHDLKSDAGARA
jgi:two-component system, NarL family, nitrate/nitrite response regulator NarL